MMMSESRIPLFRIVLSPDAPRHGSACEATAVPFAAGRTRSLEAWAVRLGLQRIGRMAHYFFDIDGGTPSTDTAGQAIGDPLALRAHALLTAATEAARVARHGRESMVAVTVRDETGAVCLKVRLISQVEVP